MKDTPKTALITGATRGIGYQIALALLRRDCHVIAIGRSQGALEALGEEASSITGSGEPKAGALRLAPLDVRDEEAVAGFARALGEHGARIDLWFHTVWHSAPMQPAAHMTPRDLEAVLATNITATARLIRHLTPILRANSGAKAVFFDDPSLFDQTGPEHGKADFSPSNLSLQQIGKLGQMALARSWKAESKKTGPMVKIVKPAPMRGKLRSTLFPGEDKERLSDPASEAEAIIEALIPGKRGA